MIFYLIIIYIEIWKLENLIRLCEAITKIRLSEIITSSFVIEDSRLLKIKIWFKILKKKLILVLKKNLLTQKGNQDDEFEKNDNKNCI